MRWLPLVIVAAGCGRVGFDPLAANADGSLARTCADISNVIACDDFETGLDGWGVPPGIVVVSSPIHGGSGAIEVTIDAGGSANLYVTPAAMAAASQLAARAWYYMPTNAALDHANVMTLQSVSNQLTAFVAGPAGNFNLYANMAGGILSPAGAAIPRDRWFCMELDLVVGPSGSAAMRIDGAPAGTISNVDTRTPGGYTEWLVGVGFSLGTQPAFTFFIDDVVLATTPPGC
ncbi:MAG TPA: hypothetical protein VMZ53_01270 [Kofleriaceae bacterium]|nr:hypothetical protein [Kofleriaceae bacterium]